MPNSGPKLDQARALFSAGRFEQARSLLARALQQSPGDPALSSALALTLMQIGQHDQALYHLQRAAAARPDDPTLLVNLGTALATLNRTAESEAAFRRALALAPNLPEAHQGLANIERDRHYYSAAAAHLEAALSLRPNDPPLCALYAAVLTNLARAREAVAVARRSLAAAPDLAVASMLANAINYDQTATPSEIHEAHLVYGRLLAPTLPPAAPAKNSTDPDRPLQIGIISADLRRHSVAAFMEPLLHHLDRAQFHLIVYSTTTAEDDVSARLKPLVHAWHNVAALTDQQLTDRIRAAYIDVLIETSGFTRGHRLPVLARRAAPVQITFCGYPNTTGIPAIDYRIVDSLTDPAGSSDALHSERLIRLDPCFLCYSLGGTGNGPPLPVATTGDCRLPQPVTFASFNAAMKINDPLLSLWARILSAVPNSRLLLKAFDFRDEPLRADIARRFQAAGGDPSRLEILPPLDDPRDHLALYDRVTIALDTFPYNGTTTTCEALSRGVPVVSLAGQTHASRVGPSLLSAVGLPDLVADNHDDYVALAARLAHDTARLSNLRTTLPARLRSSPLCDAPAYAARFGCMLRNAWQNWCATPNT